MRNDKKEEVIPAKNCQDLDTPLRARISGWKVEAHADGGYCYANPVGKYALLFTEREDF